MKIFIDSADVEEIRSLNSIGIVDGVTTNPSLIKDSGSSSYIEVLDAICKEVRGPVSAEVLATETDAMVNEGLKLTKIAENIVVKVPATMSGIAACKILAQSGKKVNVTLCFSVSQAILAARAGATYISPFVGRMEDKGLDGLALVEEICVSYDNYPEIETEVLVASVRNLKHVEAAAYTGADVVTLPPKIVWAMSHNALTQEGLTKFLQDWGNKLN